MRGNGQRNTPGKWPLAFAIAAAFCAAAVLGWSGGGPTGVAVAQDGEVADLLDGAPVDAAIDAAPDLAAPVDAGQLPTAPNRPRRQPPPLLWGSPVDAGLSARLRHMRERQEAREARETEELHAIGPEQRAPMLEREPPPREAPHPPRPESLEE
jgi:hypothetical protein